MKQWFTNITIHAVLGHWIFCKYICVITIRLLEGWLIVRYVYTNM